MVIFNNLINGSELGAVAITVLGMIKVFVVFKKKAPKNVIRKVYLETINRMLKYIIIYWLILQYDNSTSVGSFKHALFFIGFRLVNLVWMAQYFYSYNKHNTSFVKEICQEQADLMSVLTFEELKDSPLTEKFNKRH